MSMPDTCYDIRAAHLMNSSLALGKYLSYVREYVLNKTPSKVLRAKAYYFLILTPVGTTRSFQQEATSFR